MEYLVIATVVVVAILAIRGAVSASTTSVMSTAATKVGEGATYLGTFVVQPN